MERSPLSNYEITRNATEAKFPEYDQEQIISRFHLKNDGEYIYVDFVGREYRISRHTGKVEYFSDLEGGYCHADFNVVLTIFDVLCGSKPDAFLSGNFVSLNAVKGLTVAAAPGSELFGKNAAVFAGRCEDLKKACEKLGGVPEKVGDVAYKLPLFDFMEVIFQFWDADEEFEASVRILWDENILSYMRFETTFYAALHLLERLKELAEV